jgi:Lysyl oxidase
MTVLTPTSRTSSSSRTIRAGLLLVLALSLSFVRPAAGQEPVLLYPDLRPLPSRFVLDDEVAIDGATHYVIRFTTTVWNAGQGPLELRGEPTPDHRAYQRTYNDAGGFTDEPVSGGFVYSEPHQHWHFENFAAYQLWPKDDFDQWLASGRQEGRPRWHGSKTTGLNESFCLRDSEPIQNQDGSPVAPAYSACDQDVQGISVGWEDTYPFTLAQQWVDVGQQDLPDGIYVLRVVADPDQVLHQRESQDVSSGIREALTVFQVSGNETDVLPDPYASQPPG